MRLNLLRWSGLGLAAVLVLGAISVYAQLQLPAPTGPYAVGRTLLRWVDTSRPESMTPATDDYREVVAEVWYPAEASAGPRAAYLPTLVRVAEALAASGEVSALEVWGLRYVRTGEWQDAPVAAGAAAYPVLILSPGNGTNVEFYDALAGELASHGYVVVGLNHPYDVAAVALGAGNVAQFAAEAGPAGADMTAREALVQQRIVERTTDVIFALDRLAAVAEVAPGAGAASDASGLAGRLDLEHVGVWGHSLGGITAAQACLADARIGACLNLDGLQAGGPFAAEPDPVRPTQPFMFITKEAALPAPIEALLTAEPGASYWVTLRGATHGNFTDGPLLQPGLLPLPTAADAITAETRRFLLAFFDQTLKGQPSDLLAGLAAGRNQSR